MRHYRLIHEDGREEKIKRKKELTLEEMQKFVGGYIEHVHMGKFGALVDEEGLLKKLPVNNEFPQFVGKVLILGQKLP